MIEISGKVAAGLGNASGNFMQGNVEDSVAKLLNISTVTHGTLNIEIAKNYTYFDDEKYDIELSADQYNGKEFVKIKRCKVMGVQCAIVRPKDHFEVEKFNKRIEIMSAVKLREHLGLSDGTEVTIQFQGDDDWWNG